MEVLTKKLVRLLHCCMCTDIIYCFVLQDITFKTSTVFSFPPFILKFVHVVIAFKVVVIQNYLYRCYSKSPSFPQMWLDTTFVEQVSVISLLFLFCVWRLHHEEDKSRGVARIFQRGGHTVWKLGSSPDCHCGQCIVKAFLPPVEGCLVKTLLQKGGSMAPQDPSCYALAVPFEIIK